jgi:hypothetical protein
MSATIFPGAAGSGLPSPGLRVHISDASPRGFYARVIAVHPGALTVVRDDNGVVMLVDVTRRRVVTVGC